MRGAHCRRGVGADTATCPTECVVYHASASWVLAFLRFYLSICATYMCSVDLETVQGLQTSLVSGFIMLAYPTFFSENMCSVSSLKQIGNMPFFV